MLCMFWRDTDGPRAILDNEIQRPQTVVALLRVDGSGTVVTGNRRWLD